MALIALSGLLAFVVRHPLGLVAGCGIVGAIIFVMALRRDGWLFWLPALAPVIDLAAWTGQLHLTESDALVFAALLTSSIREIGENEGSSASRSWHFGPGSSLLVLSMALSYLLSTHWLAIVEAIHDPSLWMGYNTPLNGVRLAKGFFWALLLLPYLSLAMRRRQAHAQSALIYGMIASAGMVSVACLWERVAFPGITDFASDYRTTALFWETNVGGATLDGWLALTVPFVVWQAFVELRDGAGYRRIAVICLVLALAAYAVFTTFSRGLYLGVSGAFLVMGLYGLREQWRTTSKLGVAMFLGYVIILSLLLAEVFKTGGYRGMAGMLGLGLFVYGLGHVVGRSSLRAVLSAFGIALPLVGLSAAMSAVDKGIYVVYVVNAFALAYFGMMQTLGRPVRYAAVLVAALLFWFCANAALVSVYWAEGKGLVVGALCAVTMLAPIAAHRIHPALRWTPRRLGWGILAMALGGMSVSAVMLNTYYASSRLKTVESDFQGRLEHWSDARSLVEADRQHILGIGTGKFAEHYFWRAPNGQFPGDHRLRLEDGNFFLGLDAPRHVLGFGELYRVTQRVPTDVSAPFTLVVRVRAPYGKGNLAVEVCRKHLLYVGGCSITRIPIATGGTWQTHTKAMPLQGLGQGGGWIPRLTVAAIANDSRTPIEIDDLSIIDAKGRELIANGGFSRGTDFWFFSSDRHHLPWHAKNLWLHFFVEQGWFGAISFGLLGFLALFRVTTGRAGRHPLAAPLAAALVGFFAVGLFDSLVDAPRLATLAFVILFASLGLRRPRSLPASQVSA